MERKREITIYVEGESGSGKTTIMSVIAKALHAHGFKDLTVTDDTDFVRTGIDKFLKNADTLPDKVDVEIVQINRHFRGTKLLSKARRAAIELTYSTYRLTKVGRQLALIIRRQATKA